MIKGSTPTQDYRSRIAGSCGGLLFLLAVILISHRAVLFDPQITFPWDFRGFHYPLAVAYADALSERELPLWEPYSYCGRPLAANPQTAVFYPGMLAAVIGGRDGLLERLEWLEAIHIYLAGVFTFFLARCLTLNLSSSLFAATVFMLGAFFASQTQHLGVICSAPWMILACHAVLTNKKHSVPWLAFAWTMSFLAGFTAATVMTVLSTATFGLSHAQDRKRVVRDLICAGLLTAPMACIQLGLTLELVGQSVARYRTDWMGAGGGIRPQVLITLLLPDYFHVFDLSRFHGPADPSQMYLFCGWTTLAGLLLGIRRTLRLSIFCCISFLLMLGEFTPLGKGLFYLFPEFLQRTTYWYLFMAPATLGLALIAGYGVRCFGRWTWMAVLTATVELVAVGTARPMNFDSINRNPGVSAQAIDGSGDVAQRLREWAGDGRIDTADDGLGLMAAAPILRWRAASGYDPLALEGIMRVRLLASQGERWGAYYQIQRPDSPALDWMSVKVLTSRKPLATHRLMTYPDLPGRHVYFNPNARPRYYAKGCSLTVLRETRNRIDLQTECPRETPLETSEAYYSAWGAKIDGQQKDMLVSHGAFRGVSLPRGRHIVTFLYSTTLMAKCGGISAIAWACWTLLLVKGRTRGIGKAKVAERTG